MSDMGTDAADNAAARIQEEFFRLHDRYDETIRARIAAIFREEQAKAMRPSIAADGTSGASGYSGPPLIIPQTERR